MTKSGWIFIILLALGMVGCFGIQEKPETLQVRHGIIVPPLKFISPEDKKKWEGEINGRAISYYRIEKEGRISDVIVSTQDNLPEYFKRIEYFDDGGDGNLDLMNMKIYQKDKGWKDVGITRDNKYGLAYADSQYRELLGKIKEAGIIK